MGFWKSSRWYVAGAVTALAIGGGVVVGAESGDPTVAVQITPERVVDTREAGSALTTFGAEQTQFLDFTAFVPAGTRAVTVNITVVDGSSNSHLIAWPSGEARPSTSVINWEGGNTFAVANAMDVELGDDLKLGIYNHAGTVEVIVDLMGYHIDAPSGDGPAGPAGPAGADGVVTGFYVVTETVTLEALTNTPTPFEATCNAGDTVTGGGHRTTATSSIVGASRPTGNAAAPSLDGWLVSVFVNAPGDVNVYAICAETAAP